MKLDVVALGELLIDFAPLDAKGDDYPTMKANPGGAPGNYLAALSRYGAKTALLGKVGADAFGTMLVETVRQAGIETRGIRVDPEVFTTLAFVTLDPTGERSFSFARKPGADTCLRPDELDLSLIDAAAWFHFGTLSLTDEPVREAARRAVAHAKAAGKGITFDPNLRRPLWRSMEEARAQMLWGLGQADVVKLSDEEAEFLWPGRSARDAARTLLTEFGVKLAMVTLGSKGAYLANQSASAAVRGPRVTAVDTTGAGDIFGGAAVSELLRSGKAPEELSGEELRRMGCFACTAASLSTQTRGGIPSIPAREAVLRAMPEAE